MFVMKKLLWGIFFAAAALGAAGVQPVLHYDFTGPVLIPGGNCKAPLFVRPVVIEVPESAVRLTKGNFAEIPESASFSLCNGATLHCTVRFSDTAPKALDMIFFKKGDFLLGRDGNKLYFNAGDGNLKKTFWFAGVTAPGITSGRWMALSAVIRPLAGKDYQIRLYINGRLCRTKIVKDRFNPPSAVPVTLGKGWGGPWFMEGFLGQVMIFPEPLSDKQIAALCAKDPYIHHK